MKSFVLLIIYSDSLNGTNNFVRYFARLYVAVEMHGNMIFSSNFLKRWFFQKAPRWDMIFLVLSGKMVFFPPKTWIFFLWQEVRDDPSQEIHGNIIFSVYTYGCYKRGVTPLSQKKIKDGLIPQIDWHPRKSSSNSLYFQGDLCRCFHVLAKKKTGNLIYRIEVWLLLQFIQLEILYNQ